MSDDIYIGIMCLIGFDISADISVDIRSTNQLLDLSSMGRA